MTFQHIIRLFITGCFAAIAIAVHSQNPMALYFMETIPQISQINPAMQPRANRFYALTSVNQVFQSNLAFKDVFQKSGNDWVTLDSENFNYNKLYRVLGSSSNMNQYTDVNLFSFGFRTGKGYFSFSVSERVVFQSVIPVDMFRIMDKGFPDNSHFNFSTLRQKAMAYKQISLGYSHELTNKLTIGANLKPLFGQVALSTDISHFSLYTNRQQWEIIGNGTIYSSLPINVTYTQGEFPDDIEEKDLKDKDYIKRYGTSFSNPGLAADLGAVYKYDGRWTFSAAINNLGFINWRRDLNNLSFKGSYLFDGVSVDASNKDNIDQAFEDILDSLKTVITYTTDHKKFVTGLTPSFYLGASYHLNHAVSLGLLSRSTFQKHNFRQDFSLSANLQPYSFVALNLNLSQRIKGNTHMGLGLSFLAGPLQFYMLTDHIPLRYSKVEVDEDNFIISERLKDVTLMVGLNLVFGRHGYRDKPLLDR